MVASRRLGRAAIVNLAQHELARRQPPHATACPRTRTWAESILLTKMTCGECVVLDYFAGVSGHSLGSRARDHTARVRNTRAPQKASCGLDRARTSRSSTGRQWSTERRLISVPMPRLLRASAATSPNGGPAPRLSAPAEMAPVADNALDQARLARKHTAPQRHHAIRAAAWSSVWFRICVVVMTTSALPRVCGA